jgi:membrane-associated phospholipid phosphatase
MVDASDLKSVGRETSRAGSTPAVGTTHSKTGKKLNRVQTWAIACGLTIAAVVICYLAVDRPLALFIHERVQYRPFFILVTFIPEPFLVVAALIIVSVGLRRMMGWPLSRPDAVALLWSIGLLVTVALKNFFKFAFGRTWPETWINDNPSFIRDGVYAFNPFHGGKGFAAFPSGHMAVICFAATVLWFCYPRLRAVYALLIAVVAIGLMGANYHFLSDVIAGSFLGISIGCLAVALWEAGDYVRIRPENVRFSRTIRKKA